MLLFMYVLWHKSLLCINISSGMFPSLYMYPFKDSVNISATILRLHKDFFVLDLFGSCLLAAHANSGFILRKIWGRLQTVVTFWGIEILEDWHLSYHFKLFDIITIFGRSLGFSHLPYNFFAFFSIFTTNEFVFSKNKFINTL